MGSGGSVADECVEEMLRACSGRARARARVCVCVCVRVCARALERECKCKCKCGTPQRIARAAFIQTLSNTNFVVLLAFLLFVGLLIYLKVPGKLNGMLDERAKGIQSELDEARSLREEAQSILAEYERKQKEVQNQADQIVANAKEEEKLLQVLLKKI